MNKYTFTYRHNGKDWSLDYFADNLEDAQRKLQSIKLNAEFEGEIFASFGIPFIEKVIQWLRK
jgi:hypothetical protein